METVKTLENGFMFKIPVALLKLFCKMAQLEKSTMLVETINAVILIWLTYYVTWLIIV